MKCRNCGIELQQAEKYYDEMPIPLCSACYVICKDWLKDHDYYLLIIEEQNRGYAGKPVKDIDYPKAFYDYSTNDYNNHDYIIDTWQDID